MHVSGTIPCKDMVFGAGNYQTVSGSSKENAVWRAVIDMEMNSCICRWSRDRKMNRSATAGQSESVTAYEVINKQIVNSGTIGKCD